MNNDRISEEKVPPTDAVHIQLTFVVGVGVGSCHGDELMSIVSEQSPLAGGGTEGGLV